MGSAVAKSRRQGSENSLNSPDSSGFGLLCAGLCVKAQTSQYERITGGDELTSGPDDALLIEILSGKRKV